MQANMPIQFLLLLFLLIGMTTIQFVLLFILYGVCTQTLVLIPCDLERYHPVNILALLICGTEYVYSNIYIFFTKN